MKAHERRQRRVAMPRVRLTGKNPECKWEKE